MSLEDFLRKATLFQYYSGFARQSRYRGGKTPCEILPADHPAVRPEVLLLPPVLLEAEVRRHPLGGPMYSGSTRSDRIQLDGSSVLP